MFVENGQDWYSNAPVAFLQALVLLQNQVSDDQSSPRDGSVLCVCYLTGIPKKSCFLRVSDQKIAIFHWHLSLAEGNLAIRSIWMYLQTRQETIHSYGHPHGLPQWLGPRMAVSMRSCGGTLSESWEPPLVFPPSMKSTLELPKLRQDPWLTHGGRTYCYPDCRYN